MKKIKLLIIFVVIVTYLVSFTYAKAGKFCSKHSECHSGLQRCNGRGICECIVPLRPNFRLLNLVRICKSDTHRRDINEKCIYSSQCNWNKEAVICKNGYCAACDEGHELNDDRDGCYKLPPTTTTTETPLTQEEKTAQKRNVFHNVIMITIIAFCSLVFIGMCVACFVRCRNKKKRDKFPQQGSLNDESFNLAMPVLNDQHNQPTAPILPDYTEQVPEPHQTSESNVNEHPAEPNSSSEQENLWDRWLPSVEDYYAAKHNDPPPPYDFDKYFRTS